MIFGNYQKRQETSMTQLQLNFGETENEKPMEIEYVDVNDLKEPNDDSRVEIGRMLDESLKCFGFQLPILINQDNVIISGVNRVRAAKRCGIAKIPCVRSILNEIEQEKYRLIDNKTGEECGNWNWVGLAKILMKNGDMPKFGLQVNQYQNGYVDKFFLLKKQRKLDFGEI